MFLSMELFYSKQKIQQIIFFFFTLIAFTLLSPSSARAATTYYVSTTGSNITGTGASDNPWLTLNQAESSASTGDTVHVAAGTYAENDATTHGWNSQKGITWIADGTVIVHGTSGTTRPLYIATSNTASYTGFTIDSQNLYAYAVYLQSGASNKTFTNCVFQDATTGLVTSTGTNSNITISHSSFSYSGAGNAIINGNGSNFNNLAISNSTFTASGGSGTIFRFAGGTNTVLFQSNSVNATGSNYIWNATNNGTYTITNNTITQSGVGSSVFAFNTGTGTIDFENNSITTSTNNTSGVFNIAGGTWSTTIQNNVITSTSSLQSQQLVNIANQTSPAINGNTLDAMSTSLTSFVYITSTGTDGGAVQVKNNMFRSRNTTGYVIFIGSEAAGSGDNKFDGALIEGNTIYGALYYDSSLSTIGTHSIMVGYNKNATIRYNTVIGGGYGVVLKGGGMGYTGGGIFYNKFINSSVTAAVRIKGIQNIHIYNNTIYTSSTSNGSYLINTSDNNAGENASGAVLNNNILYGKSSYIYIVDTDSQTNFVSDYNLIYTYNGTTIGSVGSTTYTTYNLWQGAGYDSHSVNNNPLFNNADSYDFSLQTGSPAINQGASLGFSRDFSNVSVPQGSEPDAGAYEFLLPSSPLSFSQYKSNGITLIASGTVTNESTVVLTVIMSSTNRSDSLTPQIELRETGINFSNAVTHSGSPVLFSGNPVVGSITLSGLPTGLYHWQARVTNSAGSTSWISAGGNPDFQVDANVPTVPGKPATVSPTTNTTPTWTWNASSDTGTGLANPAYTVEWSKDSTFRSNVFSANVNTNTYTFTSPLPDGTWYMRVNAHDLASNNSLYSSSGSVTVDTSVEIPPSASSPQGFTHANSRPVLLFNKADDPRGISSYTVSLDSGKNRQYTIEGIPARGNGSSRFTWRDDGEVNVLFLNENDSDPANDQISVYFKKLDHSELAEGKHSWQVKTQDGLGNSNTLSIPFYIDNTNPAFSDLALANVERVQPGTAYNLDITNRMPSFSGLVSDIYRGSLVTYNNGAKDSFDTVSSGPHTITLTYKILKSGNVASHLALFADYSKKVYTLEDLIDHTGNQKAKRFYITTPNPLIDGNYKVMLTLQDNAGNISHYPDFYIAIHSGKPTLLQSLLGQNINTQITRQLTEQSHRAENVPCSKSVKDASCKDHTTPSFSYDVAIQLIDSQRHPLTHATVTLLNSTKQISSTDNTGTAHLHQVEAGQQRIGIQYGNFSGERDIFITGKDKAYTFQIIIREEKNSILYIIQTVKKAMKQVHLPLLLSIKYVVSITDCSTGDISILS